LLRFFILCFVALGVAAAVWVAATAQDEASPRVSLNAQAHYLSTESAQASIDINNTTDREVGYSSLSVIFLIRDSTGRQHEDRWIKTITHLPGVFWIAPGSQESFSVTLPKCDVEIDPCSEHVAVKLSFYVKSGNGLEAVTSERSYTFDPDPTATFRIDGLRNNRPLFLMQGEAHDVVPQNRAVIELHFTGDEAPKDVEPVLSAILKQHDLTLAGMGGDGERVQQFEVTVEDQGIQAPAPAALAACVSDALRHYGSRAESISSYYVPDVNFGFESVIEQARNAAHNAADAVGVFTRTAPLSDANGLTGDSTQVQFMPRSDDEDKDTPFVSYGDMLFDDLVKLREQSKVPELLDVQVRETQGFLGARPSLGSADLAPAASSEYLAEGIADVAPLPIRAVVGADRPQVFALSFTTLQESERQGFDPSALALVFARDRARALARQLGVGTGTISLAARYQELSWATDRTLLGFGIAMTMSGEPAAWWHRLAATTPAQARASTPPTPSHGHIEVRPAMMPMFSPRPVPIPTRRFVGSQGPPTTAADLVPIDVPDAATLIVSEGDVVEMASTDELRVTVAINRGDRTPDDSRLKGLPDSTTLEHELRALPDVVDVAVQETSYAPLPIGYEIIVRDRNPASVQRLVTTIASRYARFHLVLKFGASVVLSDCREQVLRAQQASVNQAERAAVVAANDQGRRLRRLVLASAYAPVTGDFCALGALPDAVDRARDDALTLPNHRVVTFHVPVKLTFRIYPVDRHSVLRPALEPSEVQALACRSRRPTHPRYESVRRMPICPLTFNSLVSLRRTPVK